MEDKDRFDAYMQLANFQREVREGRRTPEWGVTIALIALWSGLIASVLFATGPLWITILIGVVIVIGHGSWVVWNFERAEDDAAKMYIVRDKALALVDPALAASWGGARKKMKVWQHKPARFQILTSVALAAIAIGVSATRAAEPEAESPAATQALATQE